MTPSSIYQKLALVMQECRYITKTGNNTFHGYSYVTSSDVLEKINSALCNVQIATTADTELLDLREVQTAKGNMDKLATVKVTITLSDAESGEQVTISGIGSGQDAGDKAIMKAETAAIKYAYMLSFCIATGDDPEADKQTDERTQQVQEHAGKPQAKTVPQNTTIKHNPQTGTTTFMCQDCGTGISSKVHSYAMNNFGEPLCMNCQKHHHRVA